MRLSRWVVLVILAVLTLLLLGTAVVTYRSSNPPKPATTPTSERGIGRPGERPSTMPLVLTTDQSGQTILRLFNPHTELLDVAPPTAPAPTHSVSPFYVHSPYRLIALYFYP